MKGLYSIDQTLETGQRTKTYIDSGIHDNLTFVEIVCKETEKSEFIAFYFEDESGNKLSHTEWPKTMNKSIEEMTDDEKDKILGLIKQQKQRIKQIVEAITGTTFLAPGDTFKELGEVAVAATQEKFAKVKVRAKVVYDYRDYTSLSNNPNYTFIESMDIAKEESKIEPLPNDKLTRSNQRNKEQKVSNPLEADASSSADFKDKLPF